MTCSFNRPHSVTSLPYPMVVLLLKPGRVPIVKQSLICLEPENKLGGGQSPQGAPAGGLNLKAYQITRCT